MINNDIYKEALFKSTLAFALHEAIFDKNGNMIDYRFLDVNDAFIESTGFTREQVVGKRFVAEVSQTHEEGLKWVRLYEPVVREQQERILEEYTNDLKANFLVHVYPTSHKHFVTLFRNTTNEYKMERITSYFLDHVGKKIDYQLLTKMGLEFSDADYAIFNIYEDDDTFVTKAVLGIPGRIDDIFKLLGIKLIGKRFKRAESYNNNNSNISIVDFDTLANIISSVVPRTTIKQVQKAFELDKVVFAEIKKGNKIFGNFVFVFQKNHLFANSSYLNIYLKQLGVFIDKCQLEHTLGIKQLETEVLSRRMKKDVLTNAYNRSAISTLLNDRLIIAKRNRIKCYFVILDLDNFKIINDNYGHQIGDTILQQFVDRINVSIRKNDLLVRHGGDEFLLYLENVDTDELADAFMQRIFHNLSQPYIVFDEESESNLTIEVSLSAGAARFPKDGDNVKDLMSKADYTMYRVKKTGKNDFAFFALNKHSN